MRKSELDQAGPCVNFRVSAGLQVKLTLSSNAILSIILIILEAENFKLRRLMGLMATFLPAWLTNLVAACGLAHSMVAYGGLRWRLWGLFGTAMNIKQCAFARDLWRFTNVL